MDNKKVLIKLYVLNTIKPKCVSFLYKKSFSSKKQKQNKIKSTT